ncbi:carbon-nitrogen hydrolase [Syncephalis pseudoplumigaleata]|uniref:Carbon-nitrogen hydrolase n=1 Tax=Syncephalis pseudoplumigaleata TaxID=1712513 RepID=A0A4P9YSP8_9FUNG|nr:carbon-nitrogen hydrolase [Syncephalis pseudoplumigaleata]|eukprot:RKP22973.1 carbon-nitrogen hydrolase [Syncephalis pseudoplumigaleata]
MLIVRSLQPGDVDILLLPEMAFTGYVFRDRTEIEAWAEDATTGPTIAWAQSQARRLHCFVMVGYPERVVRPSLPPRYYNSACVVDRAGRLIHTYRKAYLYTTDMQWADWSEAGFTTVTLEGIGEVGIGICMDVNHDLRTDNFGALAFAHYMQAKRVQLVLILMNWLSSHTNAVAMANQPDFDNIYYWCTRLAPLATAADDHPSRAVYVVTCNRTGRERGRIMHTCMYVCMP